MVCRKSTFQRSKFAPDTTSAGDTFDAGLAVALAHGESIEDAVSFATITGAMAVTKEGVIPRSPAFTKSSNSARRTDCCSEVAIGGREAAHYHES